METAKSVLNKYDRQVHRLIHRFILKQFYEDNYQTREFNGWVADIIGGIADFEDLTIDFSDIVYDLRTNQPKGKIIEWMDANVENEQYINYHSYCLGLRHKDLK